MWDVVGHDGALEAVAGALRSGRVHHAWLFHGPAGVGKFKSGLGMARALLCHARGDGVEACGGCASCRLLAKPRAAGQWAHPDMHVIYKELAAGSNFRHLRDRKQMTIPVDLLRERMVGGMVQETYIDSAVGRKAMLAHGKVFLIDEAELLDRAGQNSLLKTLEEPPAGTYIILISANEERLLPTIRSRCQRAAFGALDDEQTRQWMAGHEELGRIEAKRRDWLVRFARGSPGRVLLAAEYGLDEWAKAVVPMVERAAGGKAEVSLGARMAELVGAYAERWVKGHKGASKDAANKAGVRHMLGLLSEVCRRRIREAADNSAPNDPAATEAAAEPWLRGIDLIRDAERNLESNVNVALLLENLAIQWGVSELTGPSA